MINTVRNFMPSSAITKRVQSILNEKIPSSDSHRLLLIDVREAIEVLGLSRKYPTINMYGDWCCHQVLDRRTDRHQILYDIQVAYEKCKEREREELRKAGIDPRSPEAGNVPIPGDPLDEFCEAVINYFRYAELRKELSEFFRSNGVNTVFFETDHNWKQFLFLLLRSIVNKTIVVPETEPLYEEMKRKAERKSFVPRKLFIKEKPDENDAQTVELWWVIEMSSGHSISGQIIRLIYPNGT